MSHPLGGKTTVAIGVMLALMAVPYLSPRLEPYRVARVPWARTVEADNNSATGAVNAPLLTQGEAQLKATENSATVTNALPESSAKAPVDAVTLAKTKGSIAIEDPSGHALDAFYARLAKTKRKESGAVTRVMHYGDSVITSDYVSGTMRRRMQAEFGDAGHGFLLVANGWDWYFHNDVGHGASEGWSSSRITGPLTRDAMYGLGGVTFNGAPGATAWFSTTPSASSTHGKKVSRFDVYYMETPTGGEVELKADGKSEKFSTKGEAKASKLKSLSVTDGEAKLTMRVVSGAPRMFGVALERDVPGVVYDAMGANGGRAELWGAIDGVHLTDQMALRDPSLVILHFGTNESETGIASDAAYEKIVRGFVDKLKVAAPNASIMIVAPLDRAEKDGSGTMRTKPIIKRLVNLQKKVAGEAGVAFWNTFEAMGGEGSMATWVRKGLAGSDLTHPSPQGAEIIGDLMFKAVTSGFEAWQSKGGK